MVCRCHDMFCTCRQVSKGFQSQPNKPILRDEEVIDLYNYLKHGSEDHKDWLLKALFHYFKGTPAPEYKA